MKEASKTAIAANKKTEVLDSVTSNTDVVVATVDATSIQEPAVPLTSAETELLAKCEATIGKGLKAFREVADALMDVRDHRLYRVEFGTFEEYCRKKWGFTARHAYHLIDAGEVVKNLEREQLFTDEPIAIPDTESAARALVKTDRKKQVEAAKRAAKKSANPTAKQFAEAVEEEEKPHTKSYLPDKATVPPVKSSSKPKDNADLEKLMELLDEAETQARKIAGCDDVVKTLHELSKTITRKLNGGGK